MTAVKACPYCFGEIPSPATKCKHCGEWVNPSARPRDELGRAANRFVTYLFITAAVGLVLGLIFFFGFWLPSWNKFQREFDQPLSRPLVK